jgi:hypothetical protein
VKFVSAQVLLDRVWGGHYGATTKHLKVLVHRLRAKLGRRPDVRLIDLERRMGYRLSPAGPRGGRPRKALAQLKRDRTADRAHLDQACPGGGSGAPSLNGPKPARGLQRTLRLSSGAAQQYRPCCGPGDTSVERHESFSSRRRARRHAALSFRARVTALAVLTVAVGLVTMLVWPRPPSARAAARLTIDMGGFHPATFSVRTAEPIRLQLINPDSQFHTDGGGWHQLAIPQLGVDAKVGPRSEKIIDIPAAATGEYPFYCDICCGGRENPTMRGVLRVTG